jgi:hypothetical protein
LSLRYIYLSRRGLGSIIHISAQNDPSKPKNNLPKIRGPLIFGAQNVSLNSLKARQLTIALYHLLTPTITAKPTGSTQHHTLLAKADVAQANTTAEWQPKLLREWALIAQMALRE